MDHKRNRQLAPTRHHLLFYRDMWESMEPYRTIRQTHELIPPLAQIGHTALHGAIGIVPMLDRHAIRRVARDFEPVRWNYLATIDHLIVCIDKSLRHPRTTPLERDLGELTIQFIEMQIPYIREYLIE